MRLLSFRRFSALAGSFSLALIPHTCLADEGSLEAKRRAAFKNIYKPSVPLRTPDRHVTSYPLTEEEITQKIRANEKHANLLNGPIESYSVNQFAANNPIEDTYDIRPELSQGPGVLAMIADGHSGTEAAHFLRDYLFDFLEIFKAAFRTSSLFHPEFFELADELFLTAKSSSTKTKKQAHHGAVYCCAHIKDKDIQVAWAGDVRAIVGRKGEDGYKAISLTKDHQINVHPGERQRLLSEHPNEYCVIKRNRIMGHLQPTRGFGDGAYKRMEIFYESDRFHPVHPNWTPPYVTARPEIAPLYSIHPNDEFLILACDGLFENLQNEEVVQILGEHLIREPNNRDSSASILVEAALFAAGESAYGRLGSRQDTLTKILEIRTASKKRKVYDDTTAIVLFFRHSEDSSKAENVCRKPMPQISPDYRDYFTEEFLTVSENL